MREWYSRLTFEERREKRKGRNAELVRKRDNARHARKSGEPMYEARRHAVTAVNNAIRRGKLERQPCEVCGAPDAVAHHDDYSKPLDVRWLCTEHHAEHHRRAA